MRTRPVRPRLVSPFVKAEEFNRAREDIVSATPTGGSFTTQGSFINRPKRRVRPAVMFECYAHTNQTKIGVKSGIIQTGSLPNACYPWVEADKTVSALNDGDYYLWLSIAVGSSSGYIESTPTLNTCAVADLGSTEVGTLTTVGRILCEFTIAGNKCVWIDQIWRAGIMTMPVWYIAITSGAYYVSDRFSLVFDCSGYPGGGGALLTTAAFTFNEMPVG